MAAPAMRQPQEQGLREICTLLEAHISPNSDQARIWQQLQHYSQFPDFNNYLVFLLARGEGKSVEVRQAAGLLLKNNLRTTFSSMPPPSQQYIKAELLPCIGAANRAIRSTVGTVISVLFQIVRVAGWIELFQALHKCLDSNDLDHMKGAMDSIYKICEDVPEELDVDVPGLSERPINVLMPRILQFFQSPHASLRKLALGCINQYIVVMPSALYMSMDQYLQGLFNLAKDPSADVRKLVCSAWVQLIEVRPSILEPHLKNVTELILQANKDSDDEVALEACEFWSAYCDVSMPPEGLREFLPQLIPTLLSNMVYADDDESLADAEEDESFPDRDQDLKPRFHASRLHGSETGEDDDDDDAVNAWNLRKCSAAGLDVLSNVFGDSILPTLMPLIEQNLARTDDDSWKERETAVLSLGAIAEGCIAGLYPHLPQIVAFLIPLLDDKFPLIRSITCWTLSRYSKFIVQSLDHPNGREQFDKILLGLLRRILDTNKRVQEAACSAFATLEEEAAEELVPHLEVILQRLMCAYGKYQRRNLQVLYDALGTLANAVGAELNQFNSQSSSLSSQVNLGLRVQGSDSGHIESEEKQQILSEDGVESSATTGANKQTSEDDTKITYSNPKLPAAESTQLPRDTDLSPGVGVIGGRSVSDLGAFGHNLTGTTPLQVFQNLKSALNLFHKENRVESDTYKLFASALVEVIQRHEDSILSLRTSRAVWEPYDTWIFCKICLEVIKKGSTFPNTLKEKDFSTKFFRQTGKLFVFQQFWNKWKDLSKLYNYSRNPEKKAEVFTTRFGHIVQVPGLFELVTEIFRIHNGHEIFEQAKVDPPDSSSDAVSEPAKADPLVDPPPLNRHSSCLDVSSVINTFEDEIKTLKLANAEEEKKENAEKLRGAMDAANTRHTELEAQLMTEIEELKAANLDLTRRCEFLEESLNREKSEKLIAVESYEKEKQERESAESSQDVLTVDLERVTQDAKRFSEQLKMVQGTNKRLQEYNASLQQYKRNLQADATKSGETISKLQKEKSAMMETMVSLRECNNSMSSQLESSRASQQESIRVKEELRKEAEFLRAELKQVRDDRDHSVAQLNNLNLELADCKKQIGKSSKECESMITKVSALEETRNTQQEQIQILQKQLAVATQKLKLADVTAIEAMTGYEEQKEKIKYLEDRLAHAESQIVEGDELRKKLHNTILELKGNIRVFCRVRPLLRFDGDSNGPEGASISFPTSVESNGRAIDLMNQGQKLSFSYDKVFDHNASQEDVFVEISQLVQSALDGYKVCIFAYGQTGSGKTYTMMGRPGIDQKGIIPRSLEQIFKTSQSLESQGWEYSMQASMLEIYNETIRDLLAAGRPNNFEMTPSKQYTIKHDSHGNTTVSDLTIIDVFGVADVTTLLEKASQSRSVGKTQMNEQSSRSHFVFTLKISGLNESTGQHVEGVLNLIDLAGSERLAKSGCTGHRLKETQSINKSLSALSDVIFAIAKGDDHVPFRNSKLTYLLQPCLGGDSKTLMFVNISPEASSVGETICSLRFASRVNACEIGIPRHQTARSFDSRLNYG